MRRRHPVSFSAESRGSEPCIVVSDSFARRRRSFVLRSAFPKVSKPKKPLREDSTHTNSNSLSGKRRRSIQDVTEPVSGSHLKLQRFAPTQRLVDDRADFCLYLELQLSTKQALEDAHALVQVTARALRAAGCSVSVHMLQAPDSEVLAVSEEEAQAYALTIGSEVPDQSVTEKGEWAGRVAMQLAPWVTQHPDYTSHVLPLTGAAQCQRLCKLILTELRLELDVCCLHEGGHSTQANSTSAPVLLSAREKLLPQVMRAKTFTNVMLYPLHRDEARRQLTRRWGAQSALALPPLQDIYAYFGPRIAMYFAWLAFYTKMLVLPAVYVVVVHVLCQLNLAPSCSVHCFKGEWMQDPVTGVRCFDYPHHKRLLRQLLAVPLLVSMCCLVVGYVVGLHVFSERLRASYKGSCTQGPYVAENWVPSYDTVTCAFVSHGPSVINAVIIHVMDNLYQLLARKLTEFENYRTLDEHEAHLVAKRMPFHLVNSNASLWFLAFYVRRLDHVRERLWILLVATQLIDNFKEVGLPLAVSVGGQVLTAENKRRRIQRQHSTLRAKRERVDVAKAATEQRLARVLMQKRQATYRDTFADYKELMVQFGYVTLYSPVFRWRRLSRCLVSFAGVAVVVNCALAWLNWAAPEVPVTSSLGKKAVLPPSVLETIVNGASLSAVNGQ
ncbi:anoctamin-like protein [Phytophthora infestans T30-4]|uniref:Anoctamin-like protein n=1 Tax=Phytophthora infestans (strain T30-4) TaxID=403677 RepID=D0N894_PHYIT|nr:anoctamin-like protein [Phytophthora infestans T30-4]EEY53779.1 anoctamin-like protein [Phytophthora infestans T30-4]|eukprot:XP_002904410.1 anoctamin-like protein [Phytophthora infestans T30-4]